MSRLAATTLAPELAARLPGPTPGGTPPWAAGRKTAAGDDPTPRMTGRAATSRLRGGASCWRAARRRPRCATSGDGGFRRARRPNPAVDSVAWLVCASNHRSTRAPPRCRPFLVSVDGILRQRFSLPAPPDRDLRHAGFARRLPTRSRCGAAAIWATVASSNVACSRFGAHRSSSLYVATAESWLLDRCRPAPLGRAAVPVRPIGVDDGRSSGGRRTSADQSRVSGPDLRAPAMAARIRCVAVHHIVHRACICRSVTPCAGDRTAWAQPRACQPCRCSASSCLQTRPACSWRVPLSAPGRRRVHSRKRRTQPPGDERSLPKRFGGAERAGRRRATAGPASGSARGGAWPVCLRRGRGAARAARRRGAVTASAGEGACF